MTHRLRRAAAALALVIGVSAPAIGADAPDRFALAPTANAAAEPCQAQRVFQRAGAFASAADTFEIQCGTWRSPAGLLTVFADPGAARTFADARFEGCHAGQGLSLDGFEEVVTQSCRDRATGAERTVLIAQASAESVVADGVAAAAPALAQGARVAVGAETARVSGGGEVDAASQTVADALARIYGASLPGQEPTAEDVAFQKRLCYELNTDWFFGDAETACQRFLSYAEEVSGADRALRAEAALFAALNISNIGRYAEAEGYIAQAAQTNASLGSPLLAAKIAAVQANHALNQDQFGVAATAASRMRVEAERARAEAGRLTAAAIDRSGGGVRIDDVTAARLDAAIRSADDDANLVSARTRRDVLERDEASDAAQALVLSAQASYLRGAAALLAGERLGALRSEASTVEASAAFAEAQATLSTLPGAAPLLEAVIALRQAQLEAERGAIAPAIARLSQALDDYRRARPRGGRPEAAVLRQLGELEAARGASRIARDRFEDAIAVERAAQGGRLSPDDLAVYFDLLHEAGDSQAAADFFAASQVAGAASTARVVALAAARLAAEDPAGAAVARDLQDARRRLIRLRSQESAARAAGQGEEAQRLAREIRAGEAEEARLEGELRQNFPEYDALLDQGVDLQTLQAGLGEDEAYLVVEPTRLAVYALMVTADDAQISRAPVPLADLESLVALLRNGVTPEANGALPIFPVNAAWAVHRIVLTPFDEQLATVTAVHVEANGALASLPFSILVRPPASDAESTAWREAAFSDDFSGVPFVANRFATTQAVDAQSFLNLRRLDGSRASRTYLGFGDFQPARMSPAAASGVVRRASQGQPAPARCGAQLAALANQIPLPGTAREVEAVSRILGSPGAAVTGRRFTDASVKARGDLDDYRVLHFATHGFLSTGYDCFPEPALLTSLDPFSGSDGLLDTGDIADLSLDADLVVLSACDTGGAASADARARTGFEGGGDQLSGLGRAFIYAGARAMLVTHWPLSDEAAIGQMESFFTAARDRDFATALQQSQIGLILNPDTSHPFFWGAFAVVGERGDGLQEI